MNNGVKSFVIDFFKDKGLPDLDAGAELLEYGYLEKGIIDSLGIVELITVVESRFDIELPLHDMQSKEFGTIGGLITIIGRLLEEGN